ncbi:hypothetical protein B0T17DRAFT_618443 [Bombardia bombarda]|uniref:Uncharacterized protein n=1 Tax=Bombardia bombarda TaxID=252184 RepID=A0AA39WM35_9PEZI|nr:hypothetical protein B0T17DRAFT_618443 [Bombardia bombarda]
MRIQLETDSSSATEREDNGASSNPLGRANPQPPKTHGPSFNPDGFVDEDQDGSQTVKREDNSLQSDLHANDSDSGAGLASALHSWSLGSTTDDEVDDADTDIDTGTPDEQAPDNDTLQRRQVVIDRIMQSLCATLDSKLAIIKDAPPIVKKEPVDEDSKVQLDHFGSGQSTLPWKALEFKFWEIVKHSSLIVIFRAPTISPAPAPGIAIAAPKVSQAASSKGPRSSGGATQTMITNSGNARCPKYGLTGESLGNRESKFGNRCNRSNISSCYHSNNCYCNTDSQ